MKNLHHTPSIYLSQNKLSLQVPVKVQAENVRVMGYQFPSPFTYSRTFWDQIAITAILCLTTFEALLRHFTATRRHNLRDV